MFDKNYEDRLAAWRDFRNSLETSTDPFRDLYLFYQSAPFVSIHTDPWNNKVWPGPWELVLENQYDDFCRVLGMCYSLQLTERFKGSSFEIHISIDNEKSETYYLLYVDGTILNWQYGEVIDEKQLPKTVISHKIHTMSAIN